MTEPITPALTVIVFQSGDWWIAQSLERDFATQGKTLHDALDDLARIVHADKVIRETVEKDVQPSRPAPQEYFDSLPGVEQLRSERDVAIHERDEARDRVQYWQEMVTRLGAKVAVTRQAQTVEALQAEIWTTDIRWAETLNESHQRLLAILAKLGVEVRPA